MKDLKKDALLKRKDNLRAELSKLPYPNNKQGIQILMAISTIENLLKAIEDGVSPKQALLNQQVRSNIDDGIRKNTNRYL